MFCSISGEIPANPVVARVNGFLYEKSLISKYIKDTGKCPVTGVPLTDEDLVEVIANKSIRPRTVNSTSIPGLLATFQNEWDEVMLETFSLKQQLDQARQELSHSMYQHDAACRLIARLTKERDEALALVAHLQGSGSAYVTPAASSNGSNSNASTAAEASSAMDVSSSSHSSVSADAAQVIPERVISEINDKCKELSTKRKGRKASEKLTSRDALPTFTQVSSFTPHKADNKMQITCLKTHSKFLTGFNDEVVQEVAFTGSTDKTAVLTDLSNGHVLTKLNGHQKKVTALSFHSAGSSVLITGSADKTVKIWNSVSSGKYSEAWSYAGHTAEVSGITLHPTDHYLTSTCLDGSWHFLDINAGACLKKIFAPTGVSDGYEYSSCAFHPDGLILGTGTSTGVLKVWDIREQQNVANCAEHTAAIRSVVFSENGYLVATGSDDGQVKIWDLRKLICTKSLEVGPGAVSSVSFDYSGAYLAIGGGGAAGASVQVRVVKDWSQSVAFHDSHTKPVTGVAWTENAASLVSASADRTVKVFSLPISA